MISTLHPLLARQPCPLTLYDDQRAVTTAAAQVRFTAPRMHHMHTLGISLVAGIWRTATPRQPAAAATRPV